MSENRIALALSRLFEKHRIVFWYDAKQELREDFESLVLPGVEKLELANNEYGIKYRILREQPEQKFLIFCDGPQPNDLDNWLLDVQLAHAEFRTDQGSIWLSELELGLDFAELVEIHVDFFQAAKRRDSLKRLLKADDTVGMIQLKMLAVCAGCEPRIDAVLEQMLDELSERFQQGAENQPGEKYKLIQRCKLDDYFWAQLKRNYGYVASEPSIKDFVIQLFKDCYFENFNESNVQSNACLSDDALVFLKRWKDSRQFETCFEKLSNECAEVLGIEQALSKQDFRELIYLDYFRLIDQKIISDLVRAVASRTVSSSDVAIWVRQRRQGHWYRDEFSHLYEALDVAAQFMHILGETKFEMDSLADGVQRYSRFWFQLDQLYRKFTYHVRMSGQASLMMEALTDLIENLYSNSYLLKVNDLWQSFVDRTNLWSDPDILLQRQFFERRVQPFLKKDNKVCVIISDAMRYEIGDELLSLIRQEDRYSADLEAMLSMLPSYTQLGMAALLPHKAIKIVDNDTGTVEINGLSSQGTANRAKILKAALDGRADALTSEDFMDLNREDSRALFKANDVLYIYHNRIDHTGDKIHSEGQAFEAAQQTLGELVQLVKKLTASNANNILITADHGFIYQHKAIEESDFLGADAEGEQILFRDRRFVLGKGLKETAGLRKFTSAQLGLSGEVEVLIPKSINRLRVKGSGSRFVHGGASLQEVVIPVLKINKKRQSDISAVDIDILRGGSSVITSGQLAVVLYQAQPVTEKVQPRTLKAGIYTDSGDLISDSHELVFDLTSDNPRDREQQVRFVLTRKADEANGQEVTLKLEEKQIGTSHYKEYKSLRYLVRRSFTSDFDF